MPNLRATLRPFGVHKAISKLPHQSRSPLFGQSLCISYFRVHAAPALSDALATTAQALHRSGGLTRLAPYACLGWSSPSAHGDCHPCHHRWILLLPYPATLPSVL